MNYIKKTILAYEDSFDQYSQKRAGKTSDSIPLLEKFASFLKGKNILEIGFGLGQDAVWFTNQGFNYTGVDPVKKFCQNLQTINPKTKIICHDIKKVKFPNETFDGIWAMASLLHLNNKDFNAVLNKCYIWLKPEGIIYISLKEGIGDKIRDDNRYFNLFNKEKFLKFTDKKFTLLDFNIHSPREYNIGNENWLNFYLRKN